MDKEQQSPKSRREFLKTIGKFAIYTPPALMMMDKAGADGITQSMCLKMVASI